MKWKISVRTYLAASLLALSLISTANARIITVDDDAPADFNNIQAAIDDASDGDTVEIGPGTYTGEGNRDIDFLGKAITVRSTDPNDPNIVAMTIIHCDGSEQHKHRGFKFINGESQSSVLAGLTISNGFGPLEEIENSQYGTWPMAVGGGIYCDGSSPTISQCVISDNIVGGDRVSPFDVCPGYGAGIFAIGGNPLITDCTILENSAATMGGGICCAGGDPQIIDCSICRNEVTDGGAGGGVYLDSGILHNCTVEENLVRTDSMMVDGGGISAKGGNIFIEDCRITNNYVLGRWGGPWRGTGPCPDSGGSAYGGGISVSSTEDDPIRIRNCIFSGNTARGGDGGVCVTSTSVGPGMDGGYGFGGAIYGSGNSLIISNCTIADNAAIRGEGGEVECQVGRTCDTTPGLPGISYGGAICLRTTEGIIRSSILSDNTAMFGYEVAALEGVHPTHVTIAFSDVEAGEGAVYADDESSVDWGRGNIFADPCFVALGQRDDDGSIIFPWINSWLDGDYHLKSAHGRWDPNSRAWVRDDVTSPCIDTGDPNSQISLEPPPNGGMINMGAYGGTEQASMSPYDTNDIADRDFDGFIYRTDLSFFAKQWLANRPSLPADLIPDNTVNFPDFAAFAQRWQCPPLPLPADNPVPHDGETGIEANPALAWASDSNARARDIYFGTTSPGTFVCRQYTNTFEVGALEPNTLYYWRVDQIGLAGQVAGPVWTFKTGAWAVCLIPQDGAVQVPTNYILLGWYSGPGALSHDVYFGTTNPPEFQINQTATTCEPGLLAYETTYYWRIDERNNTGIVTGDVWTFSTVGGKSRLCFPPDTLVWADGKPVPIVEVRPGQKVRMVDSAGEADGKFVPIVEMRPGREVSVFNNAAEVEYLQEHGVGAYDCYDMTFETGNTLVVVHSHNFLTVAGEWVAVENLRSGSKLQSLNGPITVTSVVKRAMPFVGNAYSLKIKGANLFFVGKDGIAAVDCSKLPKE